MRHRGEGDILCPFLVGLCQNPKAFVVILKIMIETAHRDAGSFTDISDGNAVIWLCLIQSCGADVYFLPGFG